MVGQLYEFVVSHNISSVKGALARYKKKIEYDLFGWIIKKVTWWNENSFLATT